MKSFVQKNKWKIIGVLAYFFYITIVITITAWLEWINIVWMLILIFVPLLTGAIIGGIIFAYHSAKKADIEEKDWKKKEQLNSDTVVPWIKEKMKNVYGDNLEISELIIKQSGRKGERTPIAYINGKGRNTSMPYHILINLLKPDWYSVRQGNYGEATIDKDVENLSFAPERMLKEVIRQETPLFSTEIEREREPEEYEIEVEEKEKPKKLPEK